MTTGAGTGGVYEAGDLALQSGQTLVGARLVYETAGVLNAHKDNVIVLPTFYTGSHHRNRALYGPGRALDTDRYFIVSINLFGNGLSSSPSNAAPDCAAHRFPNVTFYDNVRCQYQLLSELFGIERVALVIGWSMAASQCFQWAAQYPDQVDAIIPYCGSARTSPHNIVFLEGVKAALTADQVFDSGRYRAPPETGLKAFARVYAGWAYSQTFYRDGLFRELGFDSFETLLVDWERDHLDRDANDLLAMLWTWQHGDISRQAPYQGDFNEALRSITAKAVVIPCSDDLYFPPADSAIEVSQMPNAELRIFDSPWGHCVASPGLRPEFNEFLETAVRDVLSQKQADAR